MMVTVEIYSVKIRNGHYWGTDEADFEEFAAKYADNEDLRFLEFKEWDATEGMTFQPYFEEDHIVINKDQIIALNLAGIDIIVERKIDVTADINQQLMDMAERSVKVVTEGGGSNTYNNTCEVHMPGNALLLYNEIMIQEDCCSDELQSQLNSGWRIVAACPQPDQRRPDYVLGRYNPEMPVHGVAARS